VLGKIALKAGCSPFVFALYREIIASTLIFGMAVPTDGLLLPRKNHALRFILMGICSFVNVVGSVVALSLVSAPNVALLQPSIPVFAMGISRLLRYEWLTLWKSLGLALSVAGSTLVVVFSTEESGSSKDAVTGNIVLVFQCAAMAMLLVLQKDVNKIYPHKTITFWFYSIGTVLSGIAAAVAVKHAAALDVKAREIWIALGYASVFATMFNYIAMTWTNKYVEASVVSAFMTLQPVATVILSAVFLSYHVEVPQIVAGVVVIGGLLVTSYGQTIERHAATSNAAGRRLSSPVDEEGMDDPTDEEQRKQLTFSADSKSGDDYCHPPNDKSSVQQISTHQSETFGIRNLLKRPFLNDGNRSKGDEDLEDV